MAIVSDSEAFVERVLRKLKSEERSQAWLARQLGMVESTLRYQLSNPAGIPLSTALAISTVLEISIDREPAAAAA